MIFQMSNIECTNKLTTILQSEAAISKHINATLVEFRS